MPDFLRNALCALCLSSTLFTGGARAENGAAPKGAITPLQAAQPSAPPRPPAATPAPPPSLSPPPAVPVPTPRPQMAAPATSQNLTDPAAPVLKPGEILLNFQAADIQAVVKAISQMTGRNFLLDPRVKGQITIISSKPVTTQAAYQIFLSSLKAQGFTAVEGIGHTRIIPTTEAKASADVVDQPYGGEKIMTHVVIVQHNSATQMIPLLRPLMAPTSQIASYDQANALIITDYADNIRRMLRIIEKIDQPVSTDVTILGLKHASALDLADLVMRLSLPSGSAAAPGAPAVPQGQAAGDRFTIIPDMRTNSLLVRADNPGRVNQIRSLVEKLDVPATRGGQTRVVYLRNADAVKLAEVLRGLIAGEARAQQSSATGIGIAPGAPAVARPPGAASAARAEASLVQADDATNALIINAPDAIYNNLRGVIEKLDVRRTQVYVEAMIVEMSTDAAHELGIQWAGGAPAGTGAVGAIQNFPNANPGLIGAIANPITAAPNAGGLLLGYVGESVTLADGRVIRSLGALARALEQNNLANVLSTPNLMTLDNAEAKIVVGQNVPFVTGSFAQPTGTSTAVNPFQTIERKDVGLTLKIKPQVSEGGLLKLDIFQEISSVAPTSGTGASDLITNKRSIETKVLVDDGHTIVLGGLIEDNRTESEQSVPFLGRLPFIGWLFKYKQKTGKRTNLMVFLRPSILYGPTDTHGITTDRYQYLRSMNRDARRDKIFDRYSPVSPDHKPNKDKDPRRREDSDKPSAAVEKPAAPAGEAPAPLATPETPASDNP